MMNRLVPYIQIAGGVQLVILAANFFLPRRLYLNIYLPRFSRILRQIFLVHWIYILGVLLLFAGICILFAPELAGESPLGRYLSIGLAVFWTSRFGVQLGYYDAEFKRSHLVGHIVFTVAFAYLAIVFCVAALGVVR